MGENLRQIALPDSLISRAELLARKTSHSVEEVFDEALEEFERHLSRSRPQGIRRVAQVDRHAELEWVERHRVEYAWRWVAVDGDRLIASGDRAKPVYDAAKAAGVETPMLMRVPPPDEPPFAGW